MATPLAALIVAYLRIGHFEASMIFATLAAGLGVLAVFAATLFRQHAERPDNSGREPAIIGLGASACATIAALALAFTFALEGGTLIVALALSALGAATVSVRLGIPALRWCVAALGLAIAGRLAWDPNVAGLIGTTPIFNLLLIHYGVPALAFGLAARTMVRAAGEDSPVRIAQALTILLTGFLVFLEIRHWVNGGDIYANRFGLMETGLSAFSAFGFAAVLTRLDLQKRSLVCRVATFGFGLLSFLTGVIGLGLVDNPLCSGEAVGGGPFLNDLLLGYALPAAAAFVLARYAKATRPGWYVKSILALAGALIFAFITLVVRRFFQGPDLTWWRDTSEGEWYAYSAVWLVFGLVLLMLGLWRGSKELRIASAFFVVLAVAKVFLFDLAGLEGILRAFSFIGLGLVLIGIGLIYQKLVFAPPAGDAPIS